MYEKERQQRDVYIQYRYEDKQWSLDLKSTNRKESLYIARNNYKSYVQIKICIVMYNVVPEKSTL